MTANDWLCLTLFPLILTYWLSLWENIWLGYSAAANISLRRLSLRWKDYFIGCSALDASEEMSWKTYAVSLVLFNVVGIAALFYLQLIQGMLPFNPQKFGAVRWDTALNTAISFGTNTNWQAYSGEQTMSYLTQMLGLDFPKFFFRRHWHCRCHCLDQRVHP